MVVIRTVGRVPFAYYARTFLASPIGERKALWLAFAQHNHLYSREYAYDIPVVRQVDEPVETDLVDRNEW